MAHSYQYNPHHHVKIWLSSDPHLFINLENQIRLLQMVEKNPKDLIHLVYDSSLLVQKSQQQLLLFCKENNIIPVDANHLKPRLTSEYEHQLFYFYQDEISHLSEGGNLGVASDILRWLSPIYQLGTYTDFDFPIDTSALPLSLPVRAPLLLNIGSLKWGNKDFILANNDYIAIVCPQAAKRHIETIQHGIIQRLTEYDNDFMERVEKKLGRGMIDRYIMQMMKNRAEPLYIMKSKQIKPGNYSSRQIRHYIHELMSNQERFIQFNNKEQNSPQDTIKLLKKELHKKLNLIKYLFFRKEYGDLKQILNQKDDIFLKALMQNEKNLYIKSIIICTTGPIELCRALFNHYLIDTDEFIQHVQPFSFKEYQLERAFQSLNSIPIHENFIGMLRFLGATEGEINDSSWLESGRLLQNTRIKELTIEQKKLALTLPASLIRIKREIQKQKDKLDRKVPILFREKQEAEKHALNTTLKICFKYQENEEEFDIQQFRILMSLYQGNKIYFNPFSQNTKQLFTDLTRLSHQAILFGLTKNRKIKWNNFSQIQIT